MHWRVNSSIFPTPHKGNTSRNTAETRWVCLRLCHMILLLGCQLVASPSDVSAVCYLLTLNYAIIHKSFSGDSDLRIYSEIFNKQTLINSLDMCAEKSSLQWLLNDPHLGTLLASLAPVLGGMSTGFRSVSLSFIFQNVRRQFSK